MEGLLDMNFKKIILSCLVIPFLSGCNQIKPHTAEFKEKVNVYGEQGFWELVLLKNIQSHHLVLNIILIAGKVIQIGRASCRERV